MIPASLGEVSVLARILKERKKVAETLTELLKVENAHITRLTQESLPYLMSELSLKDFTLETGEKVKVALDVFCSITEEKKAEAHEWLRANDFGGLIKSIVGVAFSRDEEHDAEGCMRLLLWAGFDNAGATESVHASTLKAFLKDELKKGNPNIPLELFSAMPCMVATIK